MHQIIKCYWLLLLLLISFGTEASHHCSQWLAKVISFQGKVDIQFPEKSAWQSVTQDQTFCHGDKIRTARNSRATLLFTNESRATLDQNSTLILLAPEKKISSWYLKLLNGTSFFRSRESQRLNIHTPFINAVHEGTEFLIAVNSEQTEITVFDGQVAASNQKGEIKIKKGFTGIANKSQPPHLQALTIRPEDAVQWTLYYPPIFDYQNSELSKSEVLQPAIKANQQGDIYRALTLLDKIPAKKHNTSYLTLKSSLLLIVGRVDEALSLNNKALLLEPDNSVAFALLSIIAVTKNRQEKAIGLAQKAVASNPKSAVAQIALSYAYQSQFKIESALKATEEATRLSPDNALAWARLSELQLSTGERSDALESAQKAQQLNPKLDRTQTILGFAYLAQVDIDEANTAFSEAINLNSADPLARLGLGLAKIRKGNIEEGTHDLETAVSLDPENAIMRSYLGKAYYELRKDDFAGTELAIAKKMDPNDPTAWFYDAIRKQTINRPVEALHDMQKAIELNDNRGVYRSKLLLDEDAAEKSANLSRIYNDLGFGRVALKQAWNSLGYDSTSPSAHRFLSDAYIGQPRFRIARASELLQAQLLQPINITPVQPQLTDENIGILNSIGSGSLSVNEYDPLFNANGVHVVLNGAYGSNNTKIDNAVISGVYKKLSMSLGQFHYQTDGFRQNDDYQQNVYNAFAQYAFTPDFNFQFELKSENIRSGDVSFRINGIHDRGLREKIKQDTARVGGHYQINSEQDILVSAFYTTRKEITELPPFFSIATKESGYQAEGQYLFHPGAFDLILGLGFLDLNKEDLNFQTLPTTSESFYNGYLYSKQQLSPELITVLGISFDSFQSDSTRNRDQINPKIGVMWNPVNTLAIRGAAFRTLNRPLAANQTIEPTQIAGFNQFFDGANGTSAWQYSLGIDYNPIKNLYIGGEATWRKASQPRTNSTVNQNESHHLAYFYWTPAEWMSFRTEYNYDKVDRDFVENRKNNTRPTELTTHQVPLSLNFFHASGLFAKITGTFVKQHAAFVNEVGLDKYNEAFWTVDTSLGFRLPKKIGLISLEVSNLLDNDFNYQSAFDASGPQLSLFVPEIQFFAKLSFFY